MLCKDSKRMNYCKIDKNTSLAYKSMFIYCSILIHQDMVILELIKIIDNCIYNYNRDIKIFFFFVLTCNSNDILDDDKGN